MAVNLDNPKQHDLGIARTLFQNETDRVVAAQVSSLTRSITGVPEYLQFFMSIAWEMLLWLSFPVEVLIRKDFGIRYMTIMRFFGAGVFVGLARTFLGLIFGFGVLGWLWSAAVTAVFWWNWWNTQQRFRRGEGWHSRSNGISRLEWVVAKGQENGIPFFDRIDDFILSRFIEPGFFLALGVLFRPFDMALSWLVILSAISLFIAHNVVHSRMRNELLDMLDAQIEAGHYQESLSGAPKTETEGFQVTKLSPMYKKQVDRLRQDRPAISPEYSPTVEETLGASSAA